MKMNRFLFEGPGYSNAPRHNYDTATAEEEGYYLVYTPLGMTHFSLVNQELHLFASSRGITFASLRCQYNQSDLVTLIPHMKDTFTMANMIPLRVTADQLPLFNVEITLNSVMAGSDWASWAPELFTVMPEERSLTIRRWIALTQQKSVAHGIRIFGLRIWGTEHKQAKASIDIAPVRFSRGIF